MTDKFGFGEWMKRARRELDLSQAELAARVGCALVTIQKIEQGGRRPSRQIAELLCRHLEIPTEEAERFLRLARTSDPTGLPANLAVEISSPPVGNLPAPLAPFIGRSNDVDSLRKLLQEPNTRLVTLVGPPGVGKTRLSIDVASQSQVFPDGVWFVPLAPLQDPDLVVLTLSHSLGIANVPLDELTRILRSRSMLLLLDNCEHVLAAMGDVARLLAACTRIKVLATSRIPLEIYGETVYRVEPLAFPADSDLQDPLSLVQSDAVAMFVARAKAVKAGFALTPDNAALVARLCRQLEGLPLAIELAVSGLFHYTLNELVAQIALAGSPLGVLQHSPRDFDSRHRSLNNAVAWSYNLLSEPQRAVYRSLGVFRGGFSRQAVAAIAGETSSLDSSSIDQILRELDQHNLVSEPPAANSDHRYAMLGTIRADALERCLQAGELDNHLDRHAQWFFGRMTESDWFGARLDHGLARARADQDNLRAALSWLIALGDTQRVLQLCSALHYFWEYDGYQSEGQSWLAQALALPRPAPPLLRAQALFDGSVLAFQQGNYATAQAWCEESLSLSTAAGQTAETAAAMLILGRIAIEQGQYTAAQTWVEQALAAYRSVDDSYGVASALTHLAEIALGRNDDHAAQQWAEASLALTVGLGGIFMDALTQLTLMEVALRAGRLDQARWHVLQSLETGVAHHAIRPITLALALEAALLCHLPGSMQERSQQAARLWGAVTELRQARGLSFSHGHKQRLDAYLAGARAELGPEAWQQAEQQSSRLSLDATVALAREMLETVDGGQKV